MKCAAQAVDEGGGRQLTAGMAAHAVRQQQESRRAMLEYRAAVLVLPAVSPEGCTGCLAVHHRSLAVPRSAGKAYHGAFVQAHYGV